jgi:hypothetical protein
VDFYLPTKLDEKELNFSVSRSNVKSKPLQNGASTWTKTKHLSLAQTPSGEAAQQGTNAQS